MSALPGRASETKLHHDPSTSHLKVYQEFEEQDQDPSHVAVDNEVATSELSDIDLEDEKLPDPDSID